MELRITQSALEGLQGIQAYYKEQDVPHIGDDFVAAIMKHSEMLQRHFGLSTSGKLKRLYSYESGAVKGSSNYQKTKPSPAM